MEGLNQVTELTLSLVTICLDADLRVSDNVVLINTSMHPNKLKQKVRYSYILNANKGIHHNGYVIENDC